MGLRTRAVTIWLAASRIYIRHSPLQRGKGRVGALARRVARSAPSGVVRSRDGRRFEADPADGMCADVFVAAEYEPAITRLLRAAVRPGDVCLDVGANFGWYTTLFSMLVGPNGSVHAFEPLPHVFTLLGRNVAMLETRANTVLVNAALGEEPQVDVPIYLATDHSSGHASLRARREAPEIATVSVVTLDDHLATHGLTSVDLVKIDVEGGERAVLRGATTLLSQPSPPIWMIEMARETAAPFGYLPNDLITMLREQAPYRFFAVDERRGSLIEITSFEPRDVGANVLCVPPGREACLQGVRIRARRPDDFSPDAYPGRFTDDDLPPAP